MADDNKDDLLEQIEQQRDLYRRLNQSPDISEGLTQEDHELGAPTTPRTYAPLTEEEKATDLQMVYKADGRESFASITDSDIEDRFNNSFPASTVPDDASPAERKAHINNLMADSLQDFEPPVRGNKPVVEMATADHNELTLEDLSQNTAAYAEATQGLRFALNGQHESGVDLNVGVVPEKDFLENDYVQQSIEEARAEVVQNPGRGRS